MIDLIFAFAAGIFITAKLVSLAYPSAQTLTRRQRLLVVKERESELEQESREQSYLSGRSLGLRWLILCRSVAASCRGIAKGRSESPK